MRRVIFISGLPAGIIVFVFMATIMAMCENGTINFDNGDFLSYGSMVIALSTIFFGIKSYRDNYQNGAIKFVKGLQVGMLITLVASLMYAATLETYFQINPEILASFMDRYADYHINKMKEMGASPAEIEQTAKAMTDLKEKYENPVIRFGITLFLTLPVGIAITLFSAAVLRRKEILPA